MKIRTQIVGIITVLLLTFVFSLGVQAAQSKIQLQFPHPQWGEEGFKDWWQEVTDAFHAEHPNIQIVGSSIAFDTYLDRLVLQIRSHTAPDLIFQVSALPSFMAMDAFETLDTRIKGTDIAAKWFPTQYSWPVYKGETKAVIVINNTWALLYNKELFAKAGIAAPPKNVDEFYQIAKKITKDTNNDGRPDVFGYALPLAPEVHSYNMGSL